MWDYHRLPGRLYGGSRKAKEVVTGQVINQPYRETKVKGVQTFTVIIHTWGPSDSPINFSSSVCSPIVWKEKLPRAPAKATCALENSKGKLQ